MTQKSLPAVPTRGGTTKARHTQHSKLQSAPAIVLSCEHGGNQIPATYRQLFDGAEAVLQSHRGWDPGTLRVANAMAKLLNTPLFASTTSRLLIELNRSLPHRSLFSEFTSPLTQTEKQALIDGFWKPYRQQVIQAIQAHLDAGRRVFHVAIHSFTPVWQDEVRATSVGLLYDPGRSLERSLCAVWKEHLKAAGPQYTVHRNQPYRGTSDGFSKCLRRQFANSEYAGIELEINQSLIHPASSTIIRRMAVLLTSTLTNTIDVLKD